MKIWTRLWKNQRGQSLVMYFGAIIIAVVLLAGVIEFGWWSIHYYGAQQGVDLAAVSAAQYVPLSPAEKNDTYNGMSSIEKTVDSAEKVFKTNYFIRDYPTTKIKYTGSAIPGWNTVTVKHQELLPMAILNIFVDTDDYFTIKVDAVAKAEALYQPTHVVPIGLIVNNPTPTPPLKYEESMTIDGNVKSPSLGATNPSLGILNPMSGAMSDNDAVNWIKNDYTGNAMKMANTTAGWNTTVAVQDVVNAVNQRRASGEAKMILPVVSKPTNPGGEVTIYGYACFELTADAQNLSNGSNGNMRLIGKLVKYIDTKSDRKPSSIDENTNAKYYGVRVIYLDE